MTSALVHNPTLGRQIRSGGWAELSEGTPRVIARMIEAGELAAAAEFADFLRQEMEVVYQIYAMWFPDTIKYLQDKGMPEIEAADARDAIRQKLAQWHKSALRPREEVWRDVGLALIAVTAEGTTDRHAALETAVELWRDLHDCEVDQLSGLFDLVISRHGEPALREMYEGWVVGAWFAQRYQRFDVSKIAWEEASWLLTYLGFEGHHGHLSGSARDGTIEVEEDEEKVTISFAPCGSGGRSMAGERRDGLPPLSDPAIGWPELRDPHDFTWNESGICAYCAHCCILHENLPIAAFGYPVRVTDPPKAPLNGESRCRWTVYKDLRAIPEWAYRRVGAVKPPLDAPLGSAGREERERLIGTQDV